MITLLVIYRAFQERFISTKKKYKSVIVECQEYSKSKVIETVLLCGANFGGIFGIFVVDRWEVPF